MYDEVNDDSLAPSVVSPASGLRDALVPAVGSLAPPIEVVHLVAATQVVLRYAAGVVSTLCQPHRLL